MVNFLELHFVKGADVNAKNKDGYSGLMHASARGHSDIRNMLIKAGAK